MPNNLDEMLMRLGEAPLPARLSMLDEAVFAGLALRQSDPTGGSLRAFGFAAVMALGFGIVSTGFSGTAALAASSATPFGAPPALAPSSLLASQ